MNHAGRLLLVAMVLATGRLAQALEFAIERSFATGFITSSRLRSIAVSPREDLFLMAFHDGAVFEVSRDLAVARRILAPPEPPQESTWVGYQGLTLIPLLDIFVAFSKFPVSLPESFTRQGRPAQFVGFSGGHHFNFTGAFFEEKEPAGDLHLLNGALIEHRRLPKMQLADGLIQLPNAFYGLANEVGSRYQRLGLSGMIYIAPVDLYLFSLLDGRIFSLAKSNRRPGPGTTIWDSRIVGQTDVKPLGVRFIDDIAWDPVKERLFVGGGAPPPPGAPGQPCHQEPDLWDARVGLGCKSYIRC